MGTDILTKKFPEGEKESYLSMSLPNPYSSIFERQVVSVGFISQPTISLICRKKNKCVLSKVVLASRLYMMLYSALSLIVATSHI